MTTIHTDKLRELEARIERVENLSAALRSMGTGHNDVPARAILEIGSVLSAVADEMHDLWTAGLGLDGR